MIVAIEASDAVHRTIGNLRAMVLDPAGKPRPPTRASIPRQRHHSLLVFRARWAWCGRALHATVTVGFDGDRALLLALVDVRTPPASRSTAERDPALRRRRRGVPGHPQDGSLARRDPAARARDTSRARPDAHATRVPASSPAPAVHRRDRAGARRTCAHRAGGPRRRRTEASRAARLVSSPSIGG